MHLILIEKKNKPHRSFEFMGRTGNGKNACLPIRTLPILKGNELLLNEKREIAVGDYVAVRIIDAAPRYLICEPIAISDKLYDYYNNL